MILIYLGFSNLHLWMKIFLHILSIFFPFILGFLLAYAVYPIILFLEKKKVPLFLAIITVIFLILFLFFFLLYKILPILYDQTIDFTIKLLNVLEQISSRFDFSTKELKYGILQFFNHILQNVGAITTTTTIQLALTFFQNISKFFISFISFVYSLFYMKKIRIFIKNILIVRHFKFYNYLVKLDINFIRYLKSLGILVIIQFFEYAFLFLIIGHPHWLILGIIFGVFTIIPYVGGFIGNLIAILTAFFVSTSLFYLTLFVCIFFPFLDEYLIMPKIYSKGSNIHPALSIFLLTIGGSIGSVFGVIIAIPMYLFLRTTFIYFFKDIKNGIRNLKDVI